MARHSWRRFSSSPELPWLTYRTADHRRASLHAILFEPSPGPLCANLALRARRCRGTARRSTLADDFLARRRQQPGTPAPEGAPPAATATAPGRGNTSIARRDRPARSGAVKVGSRPGAHHNRAVPLAAWPRGHRAVCAQDASPTTGSLPPARRLRSTAAAAAVDRIDGLRQLTIPKYGGIVGGRIRAASTRFRPSSVPAAARSGHGAEGGRQAAARTDDRLSREVVARRRSELSSRRRQLIPPGGGGSVPVDRQIRRCLSEVVFGRAAIAIRCLWRGSPASLASVRQRLSRVAALHVRRAGGGAGSGCPQFGLRVRARPRADPWRPGGRRRRS